MADDYIPTTEGLVDLLLANDPSFGLYKRQHWQRVVRDEIAPWLAAHDVAKRAEWEAEQGETEWGYLSGETTIGGDPHVQRVGYDGEPFTREQASGRGRQLMRRRKAGAWLPVPDTGAES